MKPIFVTGVERSGTSMIAKIIAESGVFVGRTTKLMESLPVKRLLDTYYKNQGYDVHGQYPIPPRSNIMIPTDWRNNVEIVLRNEGMQEKGTFLLKSNRLSQTWRIWAYAFPEAQWIIIRRRTGDIIQSCLQTDYMDAYANKDILDKLKVSDERDGWKWWIHQHEQYFVDMITEGLDVKVIWPQRMVSGDYSQIYELYRWLGLTWKSKTTIQMIDKFLDKSRL
ncbi:MAG: sulfotransferase, partial [bacterium]